MMLIENEIKHIGKILSNEEINNLKEGDYVYIQYESNKVFKFIKKINDTDFLFEGVNLYANKNEELYYIETLFNKVLLLDSQSVLILINKINFIQNSLNSFSYELDKNIIDSFNKVLSLYFKDENYELKIDNEQIEIYLKYNDITITNTNNDSHFIKSIFVKLIYNKMSNDFEGGIYGYRGEMSVKELNNKYLHSHLTTKDSYFTKFCLSNSEINSLLIDLNEGYDELKFELLLHNLPEYLKWESLEGGPFMRIDQLDYQISSDNELDDETKNLVISRTIDNFISLKHKFNTKYDLINKYIKIIDDDLLISGILDCIPKEYVGFYINGSFFNLSSKDELIKDATSKLNKYKTFDFKGELYPKMYIEEEINNMYNSKNIYPNPIILDSIINQLEKQINIHYLNNY